MLRTKANKFVGRCIDVISGDDIMCLSFETPMEHFDDPVEFIEKTKTEESKQIGDGFVIFQIYRDMTTHETVINWSNKLTRFEWRTPVKYHMSLKTNK